LAHLSEATGGQPALRAVQGDVDARLLFPPDPAGARQARRDPDATPHDHSHEHFTTTERAFPGVVDEAAVLASLATEHALRVKGFVRTKDGVAIVQGVGPRIAMTPADREIPEHLVGRVVVIRRETG